MQNYKMSLINQFDIYIIDNILSYLKINKTIFINKMYYKKSKKQIKLNLYKISNFYIYNKVRLSMEFEFLENINAIHSYYILFYPQKYKLDLMRIGITKLLYVTDLPVYEILLKYYNNVIIYSNYLDSKQTLTIESNRISKNKLINTYFKLYIKSLNINELVYLGW